MSRPLRSTACPELIANWLYRYHMLRALIQQHPQDEASWVWGVRHRILGYLIRRYGQQTTAGDLMGVAAGGSAGVLTRWRLPVPCGPGSDQVPVAPAKPRTAIALRPRLDHIRELNATRYEMLSDEAWFTRPPYYVATVGGRFEPDAATPFPPHPFLGCGSGNEA